MAHSKITKADLKKLTDFERKLKKIDLEKYELFANVVTQIYEIYHKQNGEKQK